MRSLYCVVALFLFTNAYSQEPSNVKISVFKPEEATKADSIKAPEYNNAIKWNWSLTTRGVFVVNYEFFLGPKFTCEPGLGVTYRDWIYESFRSEIYAKYKNPNPKFCGEVAIKFYPKNKYDFDGFYISPGVSYRKYSFGNQKEIMKDKAGYDSNFMIGYDFFDMQLKFGIQYESWIVDELYTDFYFGFAYRNVNAKYYEYNNNYTQTGKEYIGVEKKESYPSPLLGFKMGILF